MKREWILRMLVDAELVMKKDTSLLAYPIGSMIYVASDEDAQRLIDGKIAEYTGPTIEPQANAE